MNYVQISVTEHKHVYSKWYTLFDILLYRLKIIDWCDLSIMFINALGLYFQV